MIDALRKVCILSVFCLVLAGCASTDVRLGPIGGPGGDSFDDNGEYPWASLGAKTRLATLDKEECQRYPFGDTFITDFFQAGYLQPDGEPYPGTKRGRGGIGMCAGFENIVLDPEPITLAADEFLIGIYGNAGEFVNSIGFITNKLTYLSSPGTGGNPFVLLAPPGYKIRKFFGRSGSVVDAIGIIAEEEPSLSQTGQPTYKLGAAGGWDGEAFEDLPIDDPSIRVQSVIIAHSGCINYLQFADADTGGNIVLKTGPHGGNGICPGSDVRGPLTVDSIPLADGEFITGLRGRAGTVINQLSIATNKRVIGPFGAALGSEDGKPFSLEAPAGYQVRRLFGRSGELLVSVGIIVEQR